MIDIYTKGHFDIQKNEYHEYHKYHKYHYYLDIINGYYASCKSYVKSPGYNIGVPQRNYLRPNISYERTPNSIALLTSLPYIYQKY